MTTTFAEAPLKMLEKVAEGTALEQAVARRLKLVKAIKKLSRIEKRLRSASGRVARRNARRSFGAQLGSVRQAMNEAYPLLPKQPKPKEPKIVPPKERTRRIKL